MNRFISSDLVRWVCPTACQRRTLSYCIEGCGAILRHCFALVWILQKSVMWWPWHRLCYCFPDRYLSLNEHIKTGILVEESGIRNQGGFTGNFWSKFHVTTWSCLRSYSSFVQQGSLSVFYVTFAETRENLLKIASLQRGEYFTFQRNSEAELLLVL